MKFLFETNNSFARAIATLTLVIVIFPQSAQKFLELLGGYLFQDTMNWFTQPAPQAFAKAVVKVESH